MRNWRFRSEAAAVFPADVVPKLVAAPVADIERRIGEGIKSAFSPLPAVVQERIAKFDSGVNAANGQIHLGKAQGCRIDSARKWKGL